MNRDSSAYPLRTAARIASVGILAAFVWACASPAATPTPSLSPTTSVVGATASASPTPGLSVSIVAAGDIACDPAHNTGAPKDCDQAATANEIGQLNPTAVLTLGDDQYEDGTATAFDSVFASTWGAYSSIMRPAIGNHEYLTKGATGYFGYFGVAAYYSYSLGDWHMISLDSEC